MHKLHNLLFACRFIETWRIPHVRCLLLYNIKISLILVNSEKYYRWLCFWQTNEHGGLIMVLNANQQSKPICLYLTDKGEFLWILRNSGKVIVGRVSIDCDQIQNWSILVNLISYFCRALLLKMPKSFGLFVTLKTCFIVHIWIC